jgi:hypothetical protein
LGVLACLLVCSGLGLLGHLVVSDGASSRSPNNAMPRHVPSNAANRCACAPVKHPAADAVEMPVPPINAIEARNRIGFTGMDFIDEPSPILLGRQLMKRPQAPLSTASLDRQRSV